MPLARRTLLAATTAAALPRIAIAQPARARTLVFAPRSSLASLDPVWSTAITTASHGFCVFDQLYGVDDRYRARPQMAEGHDVSADGRTWTIRLRPGLVFHDGEPVLARDCVASLVRWAARDTFGLNLARAVDEWEAPDDRTIRIRLKSPFPVLPDALAHTGSSPPFMMPERLAKTDPRKAITEAVGSGPLRFLADEYVPGAHIAYARFDRYVPREGAAEQTAGGKRVHFDRVEWKPMPDDATAAAALMRGEIDWWEAAQPDLHPMLARSGQVKLAVSDTFGSAVMIRFNCLQPPFDNVRLRQVVRDAVDQRDYMAAIGGQGKDAWRTCFAFYTCGYDGVEQVGAGLMDRPKDMAALRRRVEEAGYKGEKVVIMNAVDYGVLSPAGPITAELLRALGMNVEVQDMDFATLMARRGQRGAVTAGGWSLFHGLCISPIGTSPPQNMYVQGQGASGWFGWFASPEIEALQQRWIEAPNEAARIGVMNEMQRVAFDQVSAVPLGQFYSSTAFRAELDGFLPSAVPLMWNMRRG